MRATRSAVRAPWPAGRRETAVSPRPNRAATASGVGPDAVEGKQEPFVLGVAHELDLTGAGALPHREREHASGHEGRDVHQTGLAKGEQVGGPGNPWKTWSWSTRPSD